MQSYEQGRARLPHEPYPPYVGAGAGVVSRVMAGAVRLVRGIRSSSEVAVQPAAFADVPVPTTELGAQALEVSPYHRGVGGH